MSMTPKCTNAGALRRLGGEGGRFDSAVAVPASLRKVGAPSV
jgi:hypothetical protein